MRPILQSLTTPSGAMGSINFPPIVLDVNLDPGNVNWVVYNKGTSGATITAAVWASNDDPFAPNYATDYATNALWFQLPDAFNIISSTPGTATAPMYQDTITLTPSLLTSASGSINYAPRAIQVRLSACASSTPVAVQVVQGVARALAHQSSDGKPSASIASERKTKFAAIADKNFLPTATKTSFAAELAQMQPIQKK